MNTVVLYGDVNLNIIDGSSVWLVSATEVLAQVFDQVEVILKAPIENDRLISSVDSLQNVRLHEPPKTALTAAEAASRAEKLVSDVKASAVVVRGFDACWEFAQIPSLAELLFSYVTDLPYPPNRVESDRLSSLRDIAMHSRGMFAQTEAARSYLESICPEAAGKTSLMRPMIPTIEARTRDYERLGSVDNPLRLIYSGKFAAPWKTLEMLELPQHLAHRSVCAELTVVGDKYNQNKDDPDWVPRMRDNLKHVSEDPNSGVQWLGAKQRDESLEEISNSDIGLGWRSRDLDSSLEISTKALEYSLAGTVPIVNRTVDHEAIFGLDYPFYADSAATVEELADLISENLGELARARRAAREAASAFTMESAAAYLRNVFFRRGVLRDPQKHAGKRPPLRIVIASHDMKFMGELMQFLERDPRFEVRLDEWKSLQVHEEKQSKRLADWADVVFCEWAGPALRWYSANLPRRVKLYSRLHRFEMNGAWMSEVEWENVDGIVFVSTFIRDEVVDRFPIDKAKTHVIPNAVDSMDFDRPKLPNAQFRLGMAGYVPFLKRPDRAVDLISRLRQVDSRYTLHLKGRLPWDYAYEWNRPLQRQAYLDFFNRISQDTVLRQCVVLEPFSADIASWQRGIGFTLSPSTLESFHLAPAEGMAAGSIPLVWPRAGAEGIFGSYVISSLDEAVERVLALRGPQDFEIASEKAKSEALKWDLEQLTGLWARLFLQG